VVTHIGEQVREGELRVIDLPADVLLIEQIEDGRLRVAGRSWEVIPDVPERGARQQVEAIRKRLGQRRREVVVADGKRIVERVIDA
jgi:hypothetical protein